MVLLCKVLCHATSAPSFCASIDHNSTKAWIVDVDNGFIHDRVLPGYDVKKTALKYQRVEWTRSFMIEIIVACFDIIIIIVPLW